MLTLLLALLAPALATQGGAPDAPAQTPAEPPPPRLDPDALEAAALALEAVLEAELLAGPRALDWELFGARLAPELEARFPGPGAGATGEVLGVRYERYADGGEPGGREALVAALRAQLAGWTKVERARVELVALEPGESPRARARLELAGRVGAQGRAQLQAELDLAFAPASEKALRLRRVELLAGVRAERAAPLLVDVSGEVGVGLELSQQNAALVQSLVDLREPELVGGLSVVDWNRDGRPDLLATRRRQASQLFVNDGAGGFARASLPLDQPRECPHALLFLDLDGDGAEELVGSEVTGYDGELAWLPLWTRRQGEWRRLERALAFELPRGLRDLQYVALVPADVDGDGLLDLYAVGHRSGASQEARRRPFAAFDGARDLLFLNQGGLAFREEGRARGLEGAQYGTAALFCDLDGDGDLDLVQGNAHGPDGVYRNDGAGRFERVAGHPLGSSAASTQGLALVDLDGTGELALYRSAPSSAVAERLHALAARTDPALGELLAGLGAGGSLWRLGDEAEDPARVARALGLARAGWAYAPLALDLDGDGSKELVLAAGRSSHRDATLPDWSSLYWHQVAGDAVNLVRGAPRLSIDPELARRFQGSFAGREPERLFVAPEGGGARLELGYVLGLGALEDGRALAALDFDGDGDLDLATHSVTALRLYENRAQPAPGARVALEARGGSALGARVTLRAGGRAQVALVQATSGLSTQVSSELHFGLGGAKAVEEIEVRWPSGGTQVYGGLPAGERLVLREGEAEARVVPLPSWPDALRPRAPRDLRVERRATKLGGGAALVGTTGRPTVVAFHRPGAPEELDTLRQIAAVAAASQGMARFAVVALDGSDAEALRAELDAEALALEPFLADDALLAAFFGAPEDASSPSVFVFGADGRPRRVFRRALAPGELEALFAGLGEEPAFAYDLVRRAHLAGGARDPQETVEDMRRALRAEPRNAAVHLEIGKLFAFAGELEQAEQAFARAVSFDADLPVAWYNLGTARMYLRRFADAAEAFEQALALRPKDLETQLALGTARAEAGELPAALDQFRAATGAHPEDPSAWYLRGRAAAALAREAGADPAEARAALSRALELDPELQVARDELAALSGAPREADPVEKEIDR